MNFKVTALIAVLSFNWIISMAADITGRVYDLASKKPLPGATVIIKGSTTGAVTDENGRYIIKDVNPGSYTLEASSIGFVKVTKQVILKSTITIDFFLEESSEELEEIVIQAASEATMATQQPITVTSLDAKLLQVQSVSAADVLRTSTGVAVRRTGGLGSDASVELGGLSGGAVRIFYDGIPMEYIGAGLDITNIPVGMIDRVDIYKGVMPIDKGTDALAGGINIVPRNYVNDRLEVSYEGGSFNTHRGTLLASKEVNDKLSLSFKAFGNYSENDYTMDGISVLRSDTVPNQIGNGVTIRTEEILVDDVRRFHNVHESVFAEIGVHLRDLSWANSFEYFINVSDRKDEIQNGFRITDKVVAAAFNESGALLQRIKYNKTFFADKLEVGYQGIYIRGRFRNRDATFVEKNWLEEVIRTEHELFPELGGNATDRDVDRNSHVHRALIAYNFSDNHKLTVTNFFAGLKTQGSDILNQFVNVEGEVFDAAAVPFLQDKNIAGIEWNAKWLKSQKLNTIAFAKHYYYFSEGAFRPRNTDNFLTLPIGTVDETATGYGFGVKYTPTKGLLLRASYENAFRIPTESETFGNLITVQPNLELRPEQSDNYNLGFQWDKRISPNLKFRTQVDGFLRNTTDVIQVQPFGVESSRNQNAGDTRTIGWEFSVVAEHDDFTRLTLNITDQERTFTGFPSNSGQGVQSTEGADFPNTPFFFYNVQANVGLKTFIPKSIDLQFFANYFYVEQFSIVSTLANGQAAENTFVPDQREMTAGLGYATDSKKIRISAQVNNLLNNRQLFDNFRINRPGRHFLAKIIYQF
ncbi:MAG: TonB-dependent receptor [Fulvivirga sp.]